MHPLCFNPNNAISFAGPSDASRPIASLQKPGLLEQIKNWVIRIFGAKLIPEASRPLAGRVTKGNPSGVVVKSVLSGAVSKTQAEPQALSIVGLRATAKHIQSMLVRQENFGKKLEKVGNKGLTDIKNPQIIRNDVLINMLKKKLVSVNAAINNLTQIHQLIRSRS